MIGNLTELVELYCHCNQLTELPDSIGQLINLEELTCFGNKLSCLPSIIINLRNITFDQYPMINNSVVLTPQQQRYFDWINSGKVTNFDEYYDDNLVKFAGKLS